METQTVLDGFYEEIMSRLADQVPKIKHHDIYYGQYDSPQVDEKGIPIIPPFHRPANFFEWPQDIAVNPLGLRRKIIDVVFTLHLVQDVIQEIDRRTPENVRAKGHAHLALINEVQIALEGFNGDVATNFKHFSSIAYVGLKPYEFIGQHIVHRMGFRVRIVVDAAKKFYTRIADLVPPTTAVDQINSEIDN